MTILIGLWWLALCAYTLAPFNFGLDAGHWSQGEVLKLPRDLVDAAALLGHAAAFAVGGILIRASVPARVGIRRVAFSGVLVCVGLELTQAFVPSRHPALSDLCANLAGFLTGYVSRPNWPERVLEGINRKGAIAFWAVLWSLVLITPHFFLSLSDWDETYAFVFNFESQQKGSRNSDVTFAAIYDGTLQLAEIPALRDSQDRAPRLRNGMLFAFDPAVPPESAPAAEIVRTIQSSSAFSIEFRGPLLPRIGQGTLFALLRSNYRRNFALIQDDRGVNFVVRTVLTGPDGARFELCASLPPPERHTHIVASYDRGRCALFVDGQEVAARNLAEPSVMLGLGTRSASHAVTALLCALSFLLCWQRPSDRRRVLFQGILCAYLPLIVTGMLTYMLHVNIGSSVYYWLGPLLLVLIPLISRNPQEHPGASTRADCRSSG